MKEDEKVWFVIGLFAGVALCVFGYLFLLFLMAKFN